MSRHSTRKGGAKKKCKAHGFFAGSSNCPKCVRSRKTKKKDRK